MAIYRPRVLALAVPGLLSSSHTGFPDIPLYTKQTPTSQSSERAGPPARILVPGYPFLTTQPTFMLVTVYP